MYMNYKNVKEFVDNTFPIPRSFPSTFLRGIKVIELAGLAPVPFCGLLLADFGASVTLAINESSSSLAGFEQRLCRGKEKLLFDFKCQKDCEKLRELCCSSADVLLDPYRPGTLENIGLDPAKLLKANPGLVIARITGYGQNGPMAKMGGHDINYVALSGLLPTIWAKSVGPPWPPANLLADFAGGGLLAAFGIVSALFRRAQNGGKGCVLDCSMTEGLAYLGSFVSLYRDQQWMWDDGFAIFSGKCPVYRTYATADGKWMGVGALEKKFQEELFKTLDIGGEEISEDLGKLTEKMEKIFRSKSQREWTEIFKDKDACVTPVLDMATKELGQFEQHQTRGTFQLEEEEGGTTHCWVPRPAPIEMEIGKSGGKMMAKL